MVCPNEPIGPDGAGSLDAAAVFGGVPCAPVPVVAADASPVEGCFEIGAISAARASSGVGMFAKSVDCEGGCCVVPGLICPVLGTRPGLAGWVSPSPARTGTLRSDNA